MLRKLEIGVAVIATAGICFAQSFTDVNKSQYWGKTGIPALTAAIDANNAKLEGTAGTKNGATVTATENFGKVHETVVTLASTPVVVTEQGAGTNAVGGVKIYDLPEGRILVLGVTVDSIAVTVDANAIDNADGGDVAFGTAVPGIDGVLDGTAVDLCPATSVDPITNVVSAALASSAQFDGTTTAKDIYFNMLVDDADVSATHTNTVSGTFRIHWANLGDY